MLIECKIHRPGGSYVTLGATTYHFAPNAEGRHVAEVENDEHVDRLLSIPEGYRLYRDKPATVAPVKKEKEPVKQEAQVVAQVATDHDEASGLAPADDGADTDADQDATGDDGTDQGPAVDDREALVALYVEKYGRKPHGKWDAARIRKELESE